MVKGTYGKKGKYGKRVMYGNNGTYVKWVRTVNKYGKIESTVKGYELFKVKYSKRVHTVKWYVRM